MEPNNSFRAEAQLWLTIAEKLLISRDFVGSKTFAMRVKEFDPNIEIADQILAVADTILAGEKRINSQPDWYSILQLLPQTHDSELIASQYRRLVLLLHPQRNKLAFAEQAFRLVIEAWSVLSNPSKKFLYDNELNLYLKLAPNPVVNSVGATSHEHETQSQLHHHQLQQEPPNPFKNPNINFNNSADKRVRDEGPRTIHFAQSSNFEPQQHHHQNESHNPFKSTNTMNFISGNEKRVREEDTLRPIHFALDQSTNFQAPRQQQPPQLEKQNPFRNSSNDVGGVSVNNNESSVGKEGSRSVHFENQENSTFWTSCPYCYHMYEYPQVYADCTLRCQNCRRAFHAVVLSSPPPIADGKEAYFCCWGYFPVGMSMKDLEKEKGASSWSPFSSMFAIPHLGKKKKNSGPWVFYDDDDIFVEVSDPSDDSDDDDWGKPKRKAKSVSVSGTGRGRGRPPKSAKPVQLEKGNNGNGSNGENLQGGFVVQEGGPGPSPVTAESTKKAAASNTRKKPAKVAKNLGKLDLNVEFSNQTEEPVPGIREGHGTGNGDEDNIGFFEGLDEFLSSMPILSGVADDKVKAV